VNFETHFSLKFYFFNGYIPLETSVFLCHLTKGVPQFLNQKLIFYLTKYEINCERNDKHLKRKPLAKAKAKKETLLKITTNGEISLHLRNRNEIKMKTLSKVKRVATNKYQSHFYHVLVISHHILSTSNLIAEILTKIKRNKDKKIILKKQTKYVFFSSFL